jgi:LPS-assembly protein
LAFQAPVHQHWYAVGRFNYSFQDDDSASILQREGLVEGLLGAEYDGGCWVGRVVLQQFVSSATNKTSAIFFQIEFNGLGRIGTDPLAALKRSVPNYTMINQIHSPPARFENFQ